MAETEPTPVAKPRWWTRKWAIGVAGVIVGAALAQAGGGSTPASTASPTPTPTVTVTAPAGASPTVTVTAEPAVETVTAAPAAPPAAAAITEDGTYVVGTEIKPGTYKAKSDSMCYWARLKGLSGELGDVITNHLGEGATVVTIKKTDKAFETRDCGEWKKVG